MIQIIGFILFIVLAIILVKRRKEDYDYDYDYYGYSIMDTYVKRGRKSC